MSQQPSPTPSNPVLSYYKDWADKTPYMTRNTMIALVISFLISCFIGTDKLLGNTPFFTCFSFEIYRLLFSPLVGNSILNVIMMALFFPALGANMETSLGSSAFIWLMLTLTLVTNIVFIVVCMLLYLIGTPEAVFYECTGFWVVLFGLVTIECLQTPDAPRRMMFIPVDIPSKYFPLILYAIFCFFSGIKLDYTVAMVVGFLYQKGYLDRTKATTYYLEGLEAPGGTLHTLSRSKGWILAGAAIGHDAWIALNSQIAGQSTQQAGTSGYSSGSGGNAPQGRGGFGNWAAQENGVAPNSGGGAGGGGGDASNPHATPFGGSGRALGGSSNSSISGRWLGGGKKDPSTGGDKEKEAIAAKRLAVLTQLNTEQDSSPKKREGGDALQRLQDMGFQKVDAQRALDMAGGSLSEAMQLLTT